MAPADIGNVPRYWIRPTQVLSAAPGMHRFVWDLRYPAPGVLNVQYPISATPNNTPREPRGPWVVPGTYTIRLTVNGTTHTQPLTVRMDPRVKTPAATLARQFALSKGVSNDINRTRAALDSLRVLRTSMRELRSQSADLGAAIDSLDRTAGALEGGGGGFGGGAPAAGSPTLGGTIGQLGQLYDALQDADVAPTSQLVAAVQAAQRDVPAVIARWSTFRARARERLGARLGNANPRG
jgi:hypothetical protein